MGQYLPAQDDETIEAARERIHSKNGLEKMFESMLNGKATDRYRVIRPWRLLSVERSLSVQLSEQLICLEVLADMRQ